MITQFNGINNWLSNFAPVKIILNDIEFPSVEHAYMSAKSDDKNWKIFCSNPNNKASEVKKISKGVKLVDNWNEIKLSIMDNCIKQKFSQEPFKTKLLETGDEYIQEGNFWNDKFWGVCLKTNSGENNLGKLIMKFRDELKLIK